MAKRNGWTRIDEELVCVDSLSHCLKYQCGCRTVAVDREKDDPPDFWVAVDGERFAVEITSIVTGQAYYASYKKLARSIWRYVEEHGSLKGKYALLIMRHPSLPKSTCAEWHSLVERASAFILATPDAESTEELRLFENADGYLGIKKVSGHGAFVGIIGATDVKSEGKLQEELRHLMAARVTEKRQKLEKKGIPFDCSGAMLLLYDAYGFADTADPRKALLSVEGYGWFHSIFWAASFTDRPNDLSPANPGRCGTFLYSRNDKWWRSPSMGCRE